MKKITSIPLADVERIEIRVTRCKKTLSQVKAESGADYILNGGMWNAGGSACPLLKVGGKWLSSRPWTAYGYAWDQGGDIRLTVDVGKENFLACTCLIGPWGPVEKPSYDAAQGGTRGRSAIGLKDGALYLYCSSDGSSDARTPEGLRDDLAALGWDSAVMLDSGGSSMCDFDGDIMRGDGRKVHNWICVHTTKKGGAEPPEGENTMSKKYTVMPSVGVNIRKGPGTGYDKVGGYAKGTVITVLEERVGWGRTDKGWVKLSNLSLSTSSGGGSTATGRKTDTGVPIKEMLVATGRKNRPGGVNPDTYITIHETGNKAKGADAEAHGAYVRGDSAEASRVSWHYSVDDDSIVQHIPDGEKAYHAGDGANGPGNAKSIGIEICVNADGDFEKAKANAASLVRLLMKEHQIPAANIKQHHDWSGKDCPQIIRHTTGAWDKFLDLCKDKNASTPALVADVDALAGAGVVGSPDYWKTGSGYSDGNVKCLIHAMAEYIRKEGN
ncbi:MAG: N-acetylmuramoyl-L-alanine amidase [Oscillospiraceae bacterium]|nr:N-acetylmuramoyl-L-alanine amidase [Oscillospiraceae bacterium]